MADPTRQLTRRGPVLVAHHADRHMQTYLVFENELAHISTLTTWVTLFWSAACSCWSIAFGLWSNMFITSSPSNAAKEAVPPMTWFFAVAGVAFAGLAWSAMKNKKSEVERIKRESGQD